MMYCIGFLAEYLSGKGSSVRVVLSLVASGLVASSGSLFTLSVFTLVLLVRYSPFRFPWYIRLRQAKRLAWIVFLLVAPTAIALIGSSGYRQTLATLTVSKGDSGSFVNRTASDLFALQLVAQTAWGIGVGLGSNRAASLIPTLASDIGLREYWRFYFLFQVIRQIVDKIRLAQVGCLRAAHEYVRWSSRYNYSNILDTNAARK